MNGQNSSTGLIQLLKELEEMVHAMCLGQCMSVKSSLDVKNSMYIIYSETDHQPRWDAWDKCSGLVHWEDPEQSGGEGGGRRDRDGEHM